MEHDENREKENRKKVLNQAATFTEFNYNNYVITPVLLSVDICEAASEVGGGEAE